MDLRIRIEDIITEERTFFGPIIFLVMHKSDYLCLEHELDLWSSISRLVLMQGTDEHVATAVTRRSSEKSDTGMITASYFCSKLEYAYLSKPLRIDLEMWSKK